MRITELLENIVPIAPLSPASYSLLAQQREAQRQQTIQQLRLHRQQQQMIRQKQVWSKARQAKPKPIKWRVKRRKISPKNDSRSLRKFAKTT